MPKVVFCPNCHKKIIVPRFVHQVNVISDIKIECSDKTCKGKVIIKK
jgi:hypothetical protein